MNNGYYEVRGPEANAQAVKLGGTLTMAPTLEIIEPKYGHVNGNEIYGAGDSPAMEFVIYSPIEMVDIYVSTPAAGLTPIWDSTAVYGLPTHTSFESIVWYENGVEMDRNTPFTAGKTYKVKVTVAGEDGYRFRNDIAGKVNGKAASTGIIYQPPQVILTADLGTCPASVSEVDLEIDRPLEGSKPSTSVSAFESTYGVRSSNVSWSVSNDGVNFTSMGANQTFVAGKYYRVYMDVTLASTKYVFRITTKDGSVQPAVNATVNCSPATVIKAYEQDPEDVITVYYDFGMCNDSFVEEVNVVDLVAPVAGQHPSYTANVFGTGYHIDTTRNSYEDIYWKNPPEKWYYVKNGVQWYDTTTGSYEYVYENDTFIPGHTYSCTIYISVDDGFTFARTNGAFQLTATVNGNAAEIVTGWTDTWNTRVTYEFSCSARQISSVRVDGLEEPSAGATPDYSATVAVPEDYQLDSTFGQNGIAWYNCEGMEMAPTETFMEGEPYYITIRLNAVAGAAFAAEPDFFINGKEVNTYGWWDKVVVDGNKVIAYYTFRKASAAPVLGASVSGTVTSQGSQTDAITLKLYDFNTGTLAHETTVRGNQANYSFANVTAGVYILKVTKAGHDEAEYTVVVSGTPVVKDVALYKPGTADLDSNGRVNADDAIYLLYHVCFPSAYPLNQSGDFNKDGKVNVDDAYYLLYHVNFPGTYPLS